MDLTRADQVLSHLNAMLSMLPLYGPEHPAVRRALGEATELMSQARGADTPLCLTLAGRHAVLEGHVLPSSKAIMAGLGASLEAKGANRLVIEPGVSAADVLAFTEFAASKRPLSDWTTVHAITLSTLSAPDARRGGLPGLGFSDDVSESQTGDMARSLLVGTIWNGTTESGRPPGAVLDALVAQIAAAACTNTHVLSSLAQIKSNDEYTYVHTVNVAIMSSALAQACGLARAQVHDVTTAAVLHDVGKTRTPPEILAKSGKLSADELEVMRRHARDGAAILLAARSVPDLAPIVAFEHHMHPDGTGYPKAHSGYRTHVGSRIVQVADVFDALRTNRPYRAALPFDQVREMMLKDAGKRFDADLLHIFFERVVGADGSVRAAA